MTRRDERTGDTLRTLGNDPDPYAIPIETTLEDAFFALTAISSEDR